MGLWCQPVWSGLPTLAVHCWDEMGHRCFDTVNTGHACGSLTVWVMASVGWFDSRGMCDDLPRLAWAHSPTCVWCSVFLKFWENVRWGSVRDKWGWEIIHWRVCSPVMSLCSRVFVRRSSPEVSQSTDFFTLRQVSQIKEQLGSFYGEECEERWEGYKDLTPRGCIPITGFSTKTVWCWIQTGRIMKHVCASGTQAGLLSHTVMGTSIN